MGLFIFIIILVSIIITLSFILYEFSSSKYKVITKDMSLIEEESLKKFHEDYPEKDLNFLKIEIEKISDMLLSNEESNRYTQKIQEKAFNDYKLNEFRNIIPDDVKIMNYENGQLKAQVNYILGKTEYILIMYMETVTKGRVYLKKYRSLKRRIT